jgi:hypothetical protein
MNLGSSFFFGAKNPQPVSSDRQEFTHDGHKKQNLVSLVQRNSGLWCPPGQGSQLRKEREVASQHRQ